MSQAQNFKNECDISQIAVVCVCGVWYELWMKDTQSLYKSTLMNICRKNDPDEKTLNDKHVHLHIHTKRTYSVASSIQVVCDIRKKKVRLRSAVKAIERTENSW